MEQLDGSSLTSKAHCGNLNMGAKAICVEMVLSDQVTDLKWPPHPFYVRRGSADTVVLPAEAQQ